jgi:predicted LPLAT superfamily acyltransferase
VAGERGRRMASIELGMRQYVLQLEELVREHPDQWYCFYPFWEDPLRRPAD